jgi:hypothetical protein
MSAHARTIAAYVLEHAAQPLHGKRLVKHPVLEGSSRIRMGFDRRSRRLGKGFLLPLLSILALLCPSLAGVAWAGVNVWTTNGPAGGDILALAIDPSSPATLYAGTADGRGIFKSRNGGESWSLINTGLTEPGFPTVRPVVDLAIDPSTSATLYAGTFGGGAFKSTNGGASWSAINTGLTSVFVRTLAIDPTNPATLYSGTLGSPSRHPAVAASSRAPTAGEAGRPSTPA